MSYVLTLVANRESTTLTQALPSTACARPPAAARR